MGMGSSDILEPSHREGFGVTIVIDSTCRKTIRLFWGGFQVVDPVMCRRAMRFSFRCAGRTPVNFNRTGRMND